VDSLYGANLFLLLVLVESFEQLRRGRFNCRLRNKDGQTWLQKFFLVKTISSITK
jgi:hypothetical protein